MKNYQEVVQERYNAREKDRSLDDNPYSRVNPIGFYGNLQITKAFYKVFRWLRDADVDVTSQRILDIGCGTGTWTRYFAELTQAPGNICGLDMSKYRIAQARAMNPGITYLQGDVLSMPQATNKWDIITAMVVFMHLNTEQQITEAIATVYHSLNPEGIFIWYDAYARDHFAAPPQAESYGFSPMQMEQYCRRVGFEKALSFTVFKNILWKHHSMYLAARYPMWLVALLERVLPGSPGNIMMVFRKR
jgi:ubiquinone/menaquinone biosynthesis C-methylase UbiE